MIVLDSARADHFSTYGYWRQTTPNIDQIAKAGVVFLNHFTQGTETRATIPQLLYSRYFFQPLFPYSPHVPLAHPEELFRSPDRESISLAKALSLEGVRTCMITAHPWMKSETLLAKNFDETYNVTDPNNADVPNGSTVIRKALKWIGENRDTDYFLYLHLMDTHFPHRIEYFSRSYLKASGLPATRPFRFDENGIVQNTSEPITDHERKYLNAIYDGDLQEADAHLGSLFTYLQTNESLKSTLMVITADHGELLLEEPDRFMHGTEWYDPVAKVPLIISYPDRLKSDRVKGMTESVDVMPTVLALLGVGTKPGTSMDGMNLLHAIRKSVPFREYAVSEQGITDLRYKCFFDVSTGQILNSTGIEGLKGRLFDLQEDPAETKNVWDAKLNVVYRMANEYRKRLQYAHRRYERASQSSMPASAFAIGSNSFEVRHSPDADHWERSESWNNFYLLAHPHAAPAEIEFPVPSGRYLVEFSGHGEAIVRTNDFEPIRIGRMTTRSLEEMRLHPGETMRFQSVEVDNNLFRIQIFTKDQPFLLRSIGFRPLLSIPPSEENADRLKALGYIH